MRKALLLGINDYQWGPLNGCANDAIELGKVLTLNYDESSNFACKIIVHDKSNKHEEAANQFQNFENKQIKKSTLRKEVEELFGGECDMALFFFSGHGHEDSLGGSLVTSNATRYDEGVSVSEVLTLANAATHIPEIFLVLDCCHAGHLGNIPVVDGNKAILRKGISILTASMASEVAREQNGQGLFTKVLIEGLNGGAADVAGRVTSASLYNFVDKALGAFDQRPVYKSHITSLKSIRTATPKLTETELRKIPVFFPNTEYLHQLDKAYEPKEEPRDEKKEAVFAILQKFTSASLVRPSTKEHMYFEAVEGGSCQLTPLGKLYWKMVKNNRI
ncbi:MAG: caspase family protein [Cyclobacteriaceae bacterium]